MEPATFGTAFLEVAAYFAYLDDSGINLTGAEALGWTCAHLLEPGLPQSEKKACQYQIQSLEELRDLFPQFFKSTVTKT
jgi:pyrimidine and pyridine-specific 5'-nucleotidase